MSRRGGSFRRRLMGGFLMVGLIPLVLCVAVLLNVFNISLARSSTEEAEGQLSRAAEAVSELFGQCEEAMTKLRANPMVQEALADGDAASRQSVYNELYNTVSPLLQKADFLLFDAEGSCLYSTSAAQQAPLPADWGLLYAARSGEQAVYRSSGSLDGGPGYVRAACTVRREGSVVGYVVAQFGSQHLRRLLSTGTEAGFLLLDQHWNAVYSSQPAADTQAVTALRARLLAGQALGPEDGDTYYIANDPLSGFYLLLCQPKPVADWIMQLLYAVAAVAILLCTAVSIASSLVFTRQLLAPIQKLNQAMGEVETGHYDTRLAVQGTDEFSQLTSRFNRMTEQLGANLARSIEQQKEVSDARIRMMQAQLNPHFLYNTLDTLKWLGKIHKVPEIATISADLADILRRSISSDEFVRLGDELQLLECYTEIQSIRFAGKYRFHTEVEAGLLDALLPKLTLQPLVENAIIHGFEDGSRGDIVVSAVRQGGDMLLTVRDNGCGMSPQSIEQFYEKSAPQSGHLGLYNVDAILRTYYGPDHGLRFLLPEQGRGTVIAITLPITTRKGDES